MRQAGLGTPNAAAINDALSASATAAPHEPITRLPLSLLSKGNVYTFRLRVETHVGAQSSPRGCNNLQDKTRYAMRPSLPYECPWADEEIELFRDMVTRFLDTEMAPDDEASRKRGQASR